jgi:hypothetical protein
MRENYRRLFQRHTLAGLKELAELIQDSLQGVYAPLKSLDGFLGLPIHTHNFEDLPPRDVAFIEGMLEYIENWYDEKANEIYKLGH